MRVVPLLDCRASSANEALPQLLLGGDSGDDLLVDVSTDELLERCRNAPTAFHRLRRRRYTRAVERGGLGARVLIGP